MSAALRDAVVEAAPWKFTKRTVEQYQFNGPYGLWAIITLDPRGIFQAVSDLGNYAYDGWGHHGCASFKHFLVRLREADYFVNKVTQHDRQFAYDKSIQEMKERLVERRREGRVTRHEARAAWDEIERLDETHDATYFTMCVERDCPELYGHVFDSDISAVADCCCSEWPAQALRFFEEIFRGQLVPALEAELLGAPR